jgi:hypothetical protein
MTGAQLDLVRRTMNPRQLENFRRGNIKRLSDDETLYDWLLGSVEDVRHVEVGVMCCPSSGEITCPSGECSDDCDCCQNAELMETALNTKWGFDWTPDCSHCGRNYVLVEVVGHRDYLQLVVDQVRERMTPEDWQRLLGEFPEDDDS